jgi:hypothetical protein
MQDAASFVLMYLVFPVWVAAGFADWWCHRRTAIAITSGIGENLLHWLMYAEIGVGMLAVLLFDIDAAVLAIVFGVFVVHELTVYWDLAFSTVRRDVGPFEQMVHSFLELLPLFSLGLLAMLAWPQAQAIVHVGDDVADWSLRAKQQPLPELYVLGALAASAVFNALPLLQETLSCLFAQRRPVRNAAPARGEARMEPHLEPRL